MSNSESNQKTPGAVQGEKRSGNVTIYQVKEPERKLRRSRARNLYRRLNALLEDNSPQKRQLLSDLFGSVAPDLWIEPPFFCEYGDNIRIGRNCFVNVNCVFLDAEKIIIGDGVLVGPAVQIYTANHPLDVKMRRAGIEIGSPVEIKDDVWIGGGAILLPGVTVGRGSVVAAGAVVTKDVPPEAVAAGNPARIIRYLGKYETMDRKV